MKKILIVLFVALASSLTLKAGKVVDDSLYSNILSSEVRFPEFREMIPFLHLGQFFRIFARICAIN